MGVKQPSGVLLVDKPKGRTSHSIVAQVRRMSGVKKVGHAGTLDPLATGLLIVLVGKNFTKQQAKFLKLDKRYQVTLQFGLVSDSYDSDGQVENSAMWDQLQALTRDQFLSATQNFVGEIQQQVPGFSAVKVKGKKLYELARAGALEGVHLPIKTVTVHSLELLDWQLNQKDQVLTATLSVHCSSGTYIRSLVHDLGSVLKVGAIVTELRRTSIGQYVIASAVSLDSSNELPFSDLLLDL